MTTPSESESSSFFLRWRGRQEGPLSLKEIERRLAGNEVGMLHEVQSDGEWMTLRAFFGLLKAQEQAARLRREEEERQARAEEECLRREHEERQRAEALAEEKRKNDLLEAAVRGQQAQPTAPTARSVLVKSRGIYIILGLLLGGLGIHNFYAGRYGVGAMQLILTGIAAAAVTGGSEIAFLILGAVLLWVLLELITVTEDGSGRTMA